MIIPEKIEVGFCKRTHGRYRGVDEMYHEGGSYLLGYATFKDKGKLRKAVSWEGWRDKNIPPQTLDNIPREGFQITEFDKRSSEWFGSGRTMFRIMDPYGFVLEITPANLLAIVSESTIEEGYLKGEYIWAWEGKDQALLSVNSQLYKEAVATTAKQKMKTIKPSDLKNGDVFENKKEEILTYIGKVYGIESVNKLYSYRIGKGSLTFRSKMYHVVYDEKRKRYDFLTKIDAIRIIENKTVETVDSFVEKYNNDAKIETAGLLNDVVPNVSASGFNFNGYKYPIVISVTKIPVKDIVTKSIKFDNIIHSKLRGYAHYDGVKMYRSNSALQTTDNSFSYFNQKETKKYMDVYPLSSSVDEKNNKITFSTEKAKSDYTRRSWTSDAMNYDGTASMYKENIENLDWFVFVYTKDNFDYVIQ